MYLSFLRLIKSPSGKATLVKMKKGEKGFHKAVPNSSSMSRESVMVNARRGLRRVRRISKPNN